MLKISKDPLRRTGEGERFPASNIRLQDRGMERPPSAFRVLGAPMFLVLAIFLAIATAVQAQEIAWMQSWEAARHRIATEGKPAMLYFYNRQARPCKEMDDKTFRALNVVQRLNGYIAVRLQLDENKELVEEFEIFKVPTVVFYDADYGKIDQAIGYKPPEQFIQYLDRISQIYKDRKTNAPSAKTSTASTQSPTPRSGGFAPNLGFGDDLPSGAPTSPAGAGAVNASPLTIVSAAPIDFGSQVKGTYPVDFQGKFPDAKSVGVVGDFNDWRVDTPIQLVQYGDNEWKTRIYLPMGMYEYLFYVDNQYVRDTSNPLTRTNEYGGENSMLVVGGVEGTSPKITSHPDASGVYQVTWSYYNEVAENVEIAGTFTDWKPVKMFKNPTKRGEWGVRSMLKPGEYQYKYVIDGEWRKDPDNFETSTDGNDNNVFNIPPKNPE